MPRMMRVQLQLPLLLLSLGSFSMLHCFRTLGNRVVPARRFLPALVQPRFRSRFSKERDYIDVEVVGEDDKRDYDKGSRKKEESSDWRVEEKPAKSEGTGGLFGLLKYTAKAAVGTAKSLGGGLARTLGVDEESKVKNERRDKLNTEIDKVFGKTLMGGLVGRVAKIAGGMVMEALAESANDLADVQSAVSKLLLQHSESRGALGSGVECSMPMQSSSSAVNVNGVSKKQLAFVFPVRGSSGQGQVQVQASTSQGVLRIDSLVLAVQGRQIRVPTSVGGGSGTIIDVEAL
ncbi:hypothetical protein B484DRAFT_452527 [Ochromonadaceae sp. CCMP2298]|nr:hypothetical protein B484DRAFT_452527 [Ochromonadaceae sp. CCMP2298]